MKKIAPFLAAAMGLVVAVVIYSCSQQENSPTSLTSAEGGVLLKPVSTDLVDASNNVVGKVTYAPQTPDCKVTISLTKAAPGTYFYVKWGRCTGVDANLTSCITDARGRARFTVTIYYCAPTPGTYSFDLAFATTQDVIYYTAACTDVTFK
jgi:hypothetical protein